MNDPQEPLFEKRPWGTFEVISRFEIEEKTEIKVKKITVAPGMRLSYQSHQMREEIWYIASGVAEINLDGEIKKVGSSEIIFVPKGMKHRIANASDAKELIFIEIAKGIADEKDIVRYEDDYGRT